MTIEIDRMNELFGPAISNILEESAVRHIWRLSFLVSFSVDPLNSALMKRFDVTRPEVQILYSLTQHDGLRAQDICLITGTPKNTICRSVLLLQEKGHVHRSILGDDKRAKSLELTEKGRAFILKILPFIVRRQHLMRNVLSEEEKETFDALLSKIVLALPDWVYLGSSEQPEPVSLVTYTTGETG